MNANEVKVATGFYVIGGTLRRDAPSYVRRQADQELYDGLTQGKFCYVLTSRQMGKSSLMVRTASRLREDGVGVAVLDLTAIGQNLTAEQWYDGLLSRIGRQLQLEDELEGFWINRQRLGPLQRWMQAITEVVLARYPGRLAIFVDEIDAVRSLPFSTDEFFAGIREFYNRRTEEPELERLTFCLLGVATPSDLIRDTRTTPFNIGQRIELNDFTDAEATPLAQGLQQTPEVGARLLKRALYWTGGHPYLTQRLCQAMVEETETSASVEIDRLCQELFLSHQAQERDDNLLFVRERMLRSEVDLASLLSLYEQVRRGKRVRDDVTNPLVSILRLSGITQAKDGSLWVRNRIYEQVFGQEWVEENMPDAELRRQRAAYRRGQLRAAAIAGAILIVIGALSFAALRGRQQAVAQQRIAEQERVKSERQRDRAEEEAHRADRNAHQANLSAEKAQKALVEAERQKQQAEEQRAEAERQRQQSVEQQKIAQQQRTEAEKQRDRANQTDIAYQELLIEFDKQRPSRSVSGIEVGITIWQLRPATNDAKNLTQRESPPIVAKGASNLRLIKQRESPLVHNMLLGRISANAPLSEGDRVRFTVEVSRQGYLYIIDREQYADGTFSSPYLIFPTKAIRNGDNRVSPGILIGIPALGDSPPYFILERSRPDQVAEELNVLVTSEPIPDLQIGSNPIVITKEKFELWKRWETRTERFEAMDGIGTLYTPAERAAEDAKPDDTRRLKQGDPPPQVLYRSTEAYNGAIIVTFPMRFGK